MVFTGNGLNEAEQLCRSAIDRAEGDDHGNFPAAGSLYVAMARIEMERNRLEVSTFSTL